MRRTIAPPEVEAYIEQLERLTPRELEVMCLVDQGHFSDPIAEHLDISKDRVDKIIGQARKKLNDLPRGKAAHLVALYVASQSDASGPTHPVGDQTAGVPPPDDSRLTAAADDGVTTWIEPEKLTELAEGLPPTTATFQVRDWAPIRLGRGRHNDLSMSYTLVVIAIMTAAALLTAGGAASLLTALDAFLRR